MERFFGKFYEEADGGPSSGVAALAKMRKWLIIISVGLYVVRTNKFAIKKLEIPNVEISVPTREDVLFFILVIVIYLSLLYTYRLVIYFYVEYRITINKYIHSILGDQVKFKEIEVLYDKINDKTYGIRNISTHDDLDEQINEARKEASNIILDATNLLSVIGQLFFHLRRTRYRIIFLSFGFDAVRFGSVFVVVLYALFGA